MDYLEEARKYLSSRSKKTVLKTLASIAFILAAIAERLDAFGTGAAIDDLERSLTAAKLLLESVDGRTEGLPRAAGALAEKITDVELTAAKTVGTLAGLSDEVGKIERNLNGFIGWQDATVSERQDALRRVAEIERKLTDKADNGVFNANIGQLQVEIEVINERLENLECGKVIIGKDGEVVEMVDAAMAGRLDEMDSVIRRLANRVSDLEAPAAPRVGKWQTCGECEGKGIDPDPDEEGARCGVCGGRGMVEVFVASGRTSGVEWSDRLQTAHFSVATLERKNANLERKIIKLFGEMMRNTEDLPGGTSVRLDVQAKNGYALSVTLKEIRKLFFE